MPWEVARMDAQELRIVLDARAAAKRNDARLVAATIAEMRTLWGSGVPWSAAQVMGEVPPPAAVDAAASPDAALALADEARAKRAAQEEEAAGGWADSFDVVDDVWADNGAAFEDEP